MNQNPAAVGEPMRESKPGAPADVRRIQLRELMADDSEIIIEHAGCSYRLRITRQNKLILTK